jgi:hypothetical protein
MKISLRSVFHLGENLIRFQDIVVTVRLEGEAITKFMTSE